MSKRVDSKMFRIMIKKDLRHDDNQKSTIHMGFIQIISWLNFIIMFSNMISQLVNCSLFILPISKQFKINFLPQQLNLNYATR